MHFILLYNKCILLYFDQFLVSLLNKMSIFFSDPILLTPTYEFGIMRDNDIIKSATNDTYMRAA